MGTQYAPTRPIMTAAELAERHASSYGRNYAESDDGYSDMEAEARRGWHTVAGWGSDGWDLGDWPFVSMLIRRHDDSFQLMQIVEGDRTVYAFDSEGDLHAAIDYLFLWYSAGESWSPVTYENRDDLNAGTLRVDAKFRGPYR
jgi:hypothetical protein